MEWINPFAGVSAAAGCRRGWQCWVLYFFKYFFFLKGLYNLGDSINKNNDFELWEQPAPAMSKEMLQVQNTTMGRYGTGTLGSNTGQGHRGDSLPAARLVASACPSCQHLHPCAQVKGREVGRGLFQPQHGLDTVDVRWVGTSHPTAPFPKQPEMTPSLYPVQKCSKSSLVQTT